MLLINIAIVIATILIRSSAFRYTLSLGALNKKISSKGNNFIHSNDSKRKIFIKMTTDNPFLIEWNTPHGIPPFSLIKHEHFEDAIKTGMGKHLLEMQAIVDDSVSNFEHTIAAFDRSGGLLNKVNSVYDNLCSSDCPPELQKIQLKLAGPLAQHFSAIYMYPGLFKKINEVYEKRQNLDLNSEQIRLVERFYLDFVRAGANFDSETKLRYASIVEKLANLETQFSQNVMGDESTYFIELSRDDLAGLPEAVVDAAKQSAIERGLSSDSFCITLSRSLVEPFITFSDRRDLREKAWRAWCSRGYLDASRDNRPIIIEILKLREEQARIHGYNNFAEYSTADTMAVNPQRVMELLENVWTKGKASIDKERAELMDYIRNHDSKIGENIQIEPWDWRYYAEKVRQSKYNLDQSEVKPYFSLDKMVDAIFDCANKLFGLKFTHRPDIPAYHPDVKVYEVTEMIDGNEKLVGVFLHDNFARPHKQSGAWMSEYRCQSRNVDNKGTQVIPIIVNNNNFAKGEPTLLSFDDCTTLFHEFGHHLHGMLSNVTYQRLAGTSVLKDFVELPSQLYEHWLTVPEVLKKHARHYETNAPIPEDLLEKLMKARKFNQGFQTIEYTASALVDQKLHTATIVPLNDQSMNENILTDVDLFETRELEKLGMPKGIVMRHRPTYFQHLFSSSSYSARYYVYLWAEVLDADAFNAFKEAGNAFDPDVAKKLRKYIYSSGNSLDPVVAYRLFRGNDASIDPMLKKKGLIDA